VSEPKNKPRKVSRKKDALPKMLPLSSVFRAVEKAMGQGYFSALLDLGVYRSEKGRKYLAEHIQKLFSEEEPLVLSPEIYERVAAEHVESWRQFSRIDIAEVCIKEAHNAGKNLPGPKPSQLATANTARQRRYRRKHKQG
jgi:hypothetical protein